MTATFERIKKDIRSLEPREAELLFRDLQYEYVRPSADDDNEVSAQTEWDAEIAERVKDVEEGRVELMSGRGTPSRYGCFAC